MHKRIGIFGGTFDPIHCGHLIVAREAAEKLRLDRVIFVPAGNPPHKKRKRMAPAKDRYQMTLLAVGGNKLFIVSDSEIRSDALSYTVETLGSLRKLYQPAKLFLLVGADQAELFSTWKEPDQLFRLATVCVLSRPGHFYDSIGKRWVSKIKRVTVTGIEITASGIRQRVKKGKSIDYLVPEKVKEYIKKKKLYQ
jgi:nicotinate-nucleotide adenylyltransferase